MTRLLKPHLSMAGNETVLSWVSRLAAFHTGDAVVRFLNDQCIPSQTLLAGKTEGLKTLADATGMEFATLRDHQPEQIAHRRFRFRDNSFTSEFMPRTEAAYCPRCLCEDDAKGRAARVGRWMWLFEPVRVCERHHISLIVGRKQHWGDLIRGFDEIAPCGDELARQADRAARRGVSPLQAYVMTRFTGAIGPSWLDNQSVEQASRATTMIGVLAGWGAAVNLHSLTHDDWNTAGRLGFEITRGGVDSIRQFFSHLQSEHPVSNGNVGPQAVFGPLFKWLQLSQAAKDYGPIKTVLREHILDTMAVKTGTNLLGKPVTEPRRYTVKALAGKTCLNVMTLRRALISNGLLVEDGTSTLDASVDAVAGKNLAAALSRAITFRGVPEYMNTTRGQAKVLLKEGFLKPITRSSRDQRNFTSWVDKNEIDQFLLKISEKARLVDKPTAGMLRIPDAAQKAKRLTRDIVSLLLGGQISTVEKISTERGYLSLHVKPEEIEKAIPAIRYDERPGRTETAKILGVSSIAMKRLLESSRPKFFHPIAGTGAAGDMDRFSLGEIRQFKTQYVTLGELKKRSGWHHTRILKELRTHGITPICEPRSICLYLFDRERVDPIIL